MNYKEEIVCALVIFSSDMINLEYYEALQNFWRDFFRCFILYFLHLVLQ